MSFLKKPFSRRADDPDCDGKTAPEEETAETAGSGREDPEEPEVRSEPAPSPDPEDADESYGAVLDRLTPDDVPDGGFVAPRRKKGGVLSLVLYFIFIGTFCVSAFMLARNVYAKYRGAQIYDEIADRFINGGSERTAYVAPTPTPTLGELIEKGGGTGGTASTELARVRASLASLRQTNPDTYGWITVDGTTVNYPVVRGADNDYYLDHAYTGDSLPVGSIFADFRTADSFSKT